MTVQTQSSSLQAAASTKDSSRLLRTALRGNGIFSGISGVLAVVASGPIAEFMGIDQPTILGTSGSVFLLVTGLILIGYALMLYFKSSQEALDRSFAWTAVVMDVGWVVGSAIILVGQLLPLTTAGSWAVLIVADIVLVFAVAQVIGLRRMR